MLQRLRYPELAPEGVAALSTLEHYLNAGARLEPVLLELVRLRASLLNGCEYCVGLHTAELRKHHEPESRIEAVASWRTGTAFTERERAALRWAEVITNIQEGHAEDAEFAAVREHFSDIEVVNLTLAIASINAWNRMAIAFRPQWRAKSGEHTETQVPEARPAPGVEADALGDDGGKAEVDA
jgi:AhpD family alkylhydroperoxidase